MNSDRRSTLRRTVGAGCGTTLLALPLAVPSAAQISDRGRQGGEWQTEIELAKEAQAKFLAELAEMSDEEWRETALATAQFEWTDSSVVLYDVWRMVDVEGDKKASAEKAGGVVESDEVEDYFDLDLGPTGETT